MTTYITIIFGLLVFKSIVTTIKGASKDNSGLYLIGGAAYIASNMLAYVWFLIKY